MTDATPALARIDQPPQTLRDIAQERMREAIIEGHFAPGERLVERTLCAQLGVSRTVVRETLRYLEAEGLVSLGTGRGPIVSEMDWDQARQIYDIRSQLEGSAAAAFAKDHSHASLTELRGALIVLKSASDSKDIARVFKATTAFYEVIFRQAGHQIAWDIVSRLNGRISRLRVLTLSTEDRLKPGFEHMSAIVDAICAGDENSARKAVAAHIEDAAAIARRVLANQAQDASASQ